MKKQVQIMMTQDDYNALVSSAKKTSRKEDRKAKKDAKRMGRAIGLAHALWKL